MENGMTPADIGAIMGNRDGEGFGGGAWWIIILFLFVFMGGGCWGNRQGDYSQYATAASQQQILFNQQFDQMNQRLTNIGNGICDSTYALNNSITGEGRALSAQIANCCCENRLATANLSAQIDRQTCDIASAIHAEGEATRSLIHTNEIQTLRDKVASLEMDNRMYGVVRYPNGYTYSAGNSPFCACGNGCGCGNF